jgi:uncharacterized membrane protein (DUF373 family)
MAGAQRPAGQSRTPTRERLARAFTLVEDAVDLGLGLVLAGAAIVQLVSLVLFFVRSVVAGTISGSLISVLDQTLLVLMIVEILYTIRVSLREHLLVPEPFILVALIAVVRRILVLTAEFAGPIAKGEGQFRDAMIELGLLTVLTITLVTCLLMLRKRHAEAVAERA